MTRHTPSAFDEATHWPVRFAKGRLIYDEGELSDCLYRVIDGCVRLQVNGEDGSRQIVSFLLPGDVFGLCPETRNTAAEAATAVHLMRYSLKSVIEKGSSSCAITIELMAEATAAYQQLAHHVEKIVHNPAVNRVRWFYKWLHDHNAENGNEDTNEIPMSQRDIADYLGITPETLSRSLAQMKTNGKLHYSNYVNCAAGAGIGQV